MTGGLVGCSGVTLELLVFAKVGTVVGGPSGSLILWASSCGTGPKSSSFALSIILDWATPMTVADFQLDIWIQLGCLGLFPGVEETSYEDSE